MTLETCPSISLSLKLRSVLRPSVSPIFDVELHKIIYLFIGYHWLCEHCGHPGDVGTTTCSECGRGLLVRCSICRLAIKSTCSQTFWILSALPIVFPELYHVCSKCLHVSHMQCWRKREDPTCATGCTCTCALPAYEPFSNGMIVLSPIVPRSA